MSDSKKRVLITAALPYANGPIHIGHLAGAYLPSDIYARFLKLKGREVLFICGSDEHGAAITLRAKKDNKLPQEIVDQYHHLNKGAFEDFGIDFDIFHRTSDVLHHKTAADFFMSLEQKGVFIKRSSEQYFDEEYQQFLADRYITGTCPKCSFEEAYGDQCENCGSSLSPKELIRPISTLSQKEPVLKETYHWYLPMQEDEAWLKEWIEKGSLESQEHHDPKKWRKQVIGQCKSWIDGGLHERAMTRDLDWGVKVPVEGADGKVLYVWLDAPIGYISATKAWAEQNNKNWEDYWKEDSTELIHFIGKDNIVFHCIIFPILLKRHGGFNLPINVPANEFLNLEGKKISTSRNWAVWLHEYNERFPDQQDVLRYTLNAIAPETKDSEFTWKDFQARNNSELVGIFGNFINRAVVLTHKYYNGKIPALNNTSVFIKEIKAELIGIASRLNQKLDNLHFRDAQNEAMAIARLGNKFLADTEPWKLIKTDQKQVEDILHLSLQIAANACIAFYPFLPNTAKKLQEMLGLNQIDWTRLGEIDLLDGNSTIKKGSHLFTKIEDETIEKEINALKSKKDSEAKQTMKPEPYKKNIDFDDFTKLDIRVGTILNAELVPKSNKLLKLKVSLGEETRIILSGIAKHYSPDQLKEKQVQVLCNLPPRKMMGIESNGMILMAENNAGELKLMSPIDKIADGSLIG